MHNYEHAVTLTSMSWPQSFIVVLKKSLQNVRGIFRLVNWRYSLVSDKPARRLGTKMLKGVKDNQLILVEGKHCEVLIRSVKYRHIVKQIGIDNN